MSVKNQVLKLGSSGVPVVHMQELLNQNGANLEVDGVYGPKTEAAVKKIQLDKGLLVDGMYGPETSGALTGGGTTNNTGNTAPATPETPPASGGNASTPSNDQAAAPSEGFSYDDYKESDTVSQAFAALEQHMAAKPGDYQSTWQGQINDLIDRIMNREDFSYDINSDALYQQYKDQYTALGKMAMQDTMGQAAAMTGGYGSSYASTAGNQAYQSYLSQLNEVVPELYGMARDQYNQEGQEMYTQYGLLADQENQDYGRWADSYNQWASEREHLEGAYKDERTFDYGKYADDKSYAYDDYRNAIADEQWAQDHELNVNADNRAQEAWELEQKAYAESTKSYSGTTADGKAFNNGTLTDGQVKELQAVLGVEADGKYGPESKEAADGLSAAAAYAKYVGGGTGEVKLNRLTPEEYAEAIETIENYVIEGDGQNLFAAEQYIKNLYLNENIDDDEYLYFMRHYLPGLIGQIDTTVPPAYRGAMNGGKPGGILGPNVAIKQ